MKYKFLDEIKSDVMFEAYGKDLKELFQNAAEALFSVICKIKSIKPKESINIETKAENPEELMINWLQELIAAVDTEEMFFSKFNIKEITNKNLKATIKGQPIEPELGDTVVKAVTLYKYKFEQTKKGYKVRVSLDI